MKLSRVRVAGLLALTAALVTAAAQTGSAATIGAGMSAVPPKTTPWVSDGEVDAILQVGNTMVVGGTFTSVSDEQATTTIARSGLVLFDATTGAISSVAPSFTGGTVDAIAPGPTATTVYVGGSFTTVNGAKDKAIALIDITTGQLVSTWKPPTLNGIVTDIQTIGSELVLGGTFTTAGTGVTRDGLVSMAPTTGTVDSWMTVPLLGHHNYTSTNGGALGAVGVENFALTPDGKTLVVIGNFKTAGGLARDQLALISVSGTPAVRTDWATSAYTPACNYKSFDSYVRDVAISPDGSYFVVAATGGPNGTNTNCDAATAFSLSTTGTAVTPLWTDWTGGDTLLSVVITSSSVFVGGHMRWMNNPAGHDTPGIGAVPRPGLAALDPRTGVPQAWNPGRNPRGFGTTAMYLGSGGLWIGSDTEWVGNTLYHRKRLAMFPSAPTTATDTARALPTNVYVAGPTPAGSTADSLRVGTLNQSSVSGMSAPSTASGISWSGVKGGFWVNGTLYYAAADGLLHSRTYDGTTFGADTVVDPANDPNWTNQQTGSGQTYTGVRSGFYGTEASTITTLGYSDGYLYYTTGSNTRLMKRAFVPDPGVSGGVSASYEAATSVTLPTGTTSIFFAGSYLYYVTSTGALYQVPWANGVTTGTAVLVSGPTVDGIDWRAHAVFVAP